MQIQVRDINNKKVWKSIKPSESNIPYKYKDRKTAMNMLNICYSSCDCNVKKRVIYNSIK